MPSIRQKNPAENLKIAKVLYSLDKYIPMNTAFSYEVVLSIGNEYALSQSFR